MNTQTLPILYIPSNETFIVSIVSLQSLLQNNPNSDIFVYFAIDSSFNKENLNFLNKYCNAHKNLQYKIIYVDNESEKIIKLYHSVLFTTRLYLFDVVKKIEHDKFIYIAEQSIVIDDLKELYDIDIQNNSCACTEYIAPKWAISEYNLNVDNIISGNILLINRRLWVKNYIFEEVFRGRNLPEKVPSWIFMSIVLHDYKFIDYKYDYTEEWFKDHNQNLTCSKATAQAYKNFMTHMDTPVTLTIGNPVSDNEIGCRNSYLNLWWQYAEKTPIYDEIKDYRQLNKYKLSATSAQNSFKYSWLLSRIWPYIKPYWFRILLGFLIAIPLGLLDGVTAFALKPYMDYVVGGKALSFDYNGLGFTITSIQMAFIIPIAVVVFAAIQGVLRYTNDYLSAWTSNHITNDVKFDLFHRLIHMHPQFYDDNSSGIVISRYMGDPGAASVGIVDNIKTITTSLCGALGLIAVMIYSSWKLAFIGVLILCIAFVPVIIIRKRIKEASNKNMVIGGKITTNINETYNGNKVMAAYELQDRMEDYFKKQIWESYDIGMSLLKRAGWMSPMMYLIASFGIATVLGIGTYLISSGQMTAGAFASFVTSLLLLYKPIKTLGNTLTGIQNIFVAMGRIFELFDLEPAIKDCDNPKELKGLNDSIDFENVNFEYIPNKPILSDLNLHISKNETLAIVGNSGGGKSTLVNLIPRFYDIKSGAIKIDGVDIREYSLKSLRKNISIVFQDNFLYSGTIKENILMGNPDASTEELMKSIESAHLQDMIQELPDGLDTVLGERGLTLSGGQRQRVAIARAMLRNAPIVILDEATSALDNTSEAIVQKAMDNLMQNRTVFIIAHRLSTIKNANRIAVINEGHLVELGPHDELMNIENGYYKTLYEMQFKKQEKASV